MWQKLYRMIQGFVFKFDGNQFRFLVYCFWSCCYSGSAKMAKNEETMWDFWQNLLIRRPPCRLGIFVVIFEMFLFFSRQKPVCESCQLTFVICASKTRPVAEGFCFIAAEGRRMTSGLVFFLYSEHWLTLTWYAVSFQDDKCGCLWTCFSRETGHI